MAYRKGLLNHAVLAEHRDAGVLAQLEKALVVDLGRVGHFTVVVVLKEFVPFARFVLDFNPKLFAFRGVGVLYQF